MCDSDRDKKTNRQARREKAVDGIFGFIALVRFLCGREPVR